MMGLVFLYLFSNRFSLLQIAMLGMKARNDQATSVDTEMWQEKTSVSDAAVCQDAEGLLTPFFPTGGVLKERAA